MSEIADKIVAAVQERKLEGLDSFHLALELTKQYAGSDNAQPGEIPRLFTELFRLFETGAWHE